MQYYKKMKRHPFLSINTKAKDYDPDHAAYQCEIWLRDHLVQGNCRGKSSYTYATKCTCLHSLQQEEKVEWIRGIARYMVAWLSFPNHTQQELLHMWHQFAQSIAITEGNSSKIKYSLPMAQTENLQLHRVCKNALLNVLNVGAR